MNNPKVIKGLAFTVIILFIGLAIAPSINGNETIEEYKTLNVKYYTLNGIKEVEKNIEINDVNNLYNLFNYNDNDEISSELSKLGLVPEEYDNKFVMDLISGEYGRIIFDRFKERITNLFDRDSNPYWKTVNAFCFVDGSAPNHLYLPISASSLMLLYFMIVPLAEILPSLFPGHFVLLSYLFYLIGIISYTTAFKLVDMQSKMDKRINPMVSVFLSATNDEKSYFNTSGILGKCNYEGNGLIFNMIGFFGIWLTLTDGVREGACNFKGFCTYTNMLEE